MNAKKRLEIFQRFHTANPEPKTELEYRNPFELLVAVTLSAQATDVSVNKATKGLFAAANTPAAMVKLGERGIIRHIKTIGLYNNKAKNVLAACRMLCDLHGGEVPREREALEALPGVGRKMADPAWALCLRRAQAKMPGLPDQRSVRFSSKDKKLTATANQG